MQKHEITEYQKHALPYPRSRYRTYTPSDGTRDATYQAHVRCTAATNRGYRQEPRHCGGVRASMRTAGQRRAQGRTRRQQGESTAEWQQGSPSLERSLTTTDISAPRRSSQRPPCQCLLMSITAHTHTYAHAGHKVSAHSMRGRRAGRPLVGPGLLRACCRHAGAIRCAAASCSRTESRASPCFASSRRKEGSRLFDCNSGRRRALLRHQNFRVTERVEITLTPGPHQFDRCRQTGISQVGSWWESCTKIVKV